AVLSGSTNWTSTGLCTQTNNALIINSSEVAKRYIDCWNAIKADVEAADGDQKKLQSSTQRAFNRTNNKNSINSPIKLPGGVTVVGQPGKPKKKGAKLPSAKPDFRAVPAGAINDNDAFGAWEAEMAKFGFAIIHNKIVVVDPFSDNCTVVTGSHNLGFRASHNNDENMVIIRGHRGLAEAYACHVLDLYDHYAFRLLLKQHPEIFGRPLQPDDTWQERYIIGKDEKSSELRFWL